jgi:hypothetical protein
MELYHVYMHFDDGAFGKIPNVSFEFASATVFDRYCDERCRHREGVRSCWIVNATTLDQIRGTPPTNWSLECPIYENDTGRQQAS